MYKYLVETENKSPFVVFTDDPKTTDEMESYLAECYGFAKILSMEEIIPKLKKYRAWDCMRGENGIMINNHTIKTCGELGLWHQDHLIWMEYLDRKDELGNEICEFDIVTISENIYGIVTYSKEDSKFIIELPCNIKMGMNFCKKIIGNKFENPELMKAFE